MAKKRRRTGAGAPEPRRDGVINRFTAAAGYGFLSNFHPSSIWVDGKRYPTVEHAYQAHKTLDDGQRDVIARAATPAEAKKLGQALTLRRDWDDVRIPLMLQFLRKKFESPFLADALVATGDSILIHENTWNDRFWGVCRGTGQNWLGRLLMDVRGEIAENFEQFP